MGMNLTIQKRGCLRICVEEINVVIARDNKGVMNVNLRKYGTEGWNIG